MPSKKTSRVVVVGGGFGGLICRVARLPEPRSRSPSSTAKITTHFSHCSTRLQPEASPRVKSPLRSGQFSAATPMSSPCSRKSKASTSISRLVKTAEQELPYDYLVVAAGATHAYFGHDDWEPFAPGLKTIEDALEIRRRVLLAFELAERRALSGAGDEPLNFVVVGGGPTGVELAGILAEIARHVLKHEFRSIDPSRAHIVLLEGGPRILPAYAEDLSRSAEEQLRQLGVDVRTNALVTLIEAGVVHIGAARIVAPVVLWAAGVAASPLGKKLGAPCDRAGRVIVQPDLSIPGHPEVFVIGDLASIKQKNGQPVPGLAPAAIQEGKYVAKTILRDLAGKTREPFDYWDKGTLATIGRNAAIAQFGKIHISGFIAWLSWLFIHIFFLIGFRNRLLVFIQWFWSYATYERSARLITGKSTLPGWSGMQPAESDVSEDKFPTARAG